MRAYALLFAPLVYAGAAFAIAEPGGLATTLRVATPEEPAFMLSESGVQVFECRLVPGAANEAYRWSFVAPDTTLYDGTRAVGRRTSPSLWESTADRTSVAGVPRAAQAAGGDDLPWVRYAASGTGDSGLFAGVTSIQRVNTRGGVAPVNGCTAETVGSEARVAYSADDYFYKRAVR